jgi:hypothetical protein
MRERAALLGGSLRVERGVNGIGTSVHACVPILAPGTEPDAGTSGVALAVAALAVETAVQSVRNAGEVEQVLQSLKLEEVKLPTQLAAPAPLHSGAGKRASA